MNAQLKPSRGTELCHYNGYTCSGRHCGKCGSHLRERDGDLCSECVRWQKFFATFPFGEPA